MNLTVDGMGAVFDVPSRTVDEFIAGKAVYYSCEVRCWYYIHWGLDLPFWNWIVSCQTEQEGENFTVEVLDVLPELQVKPDRGGGDDRR